MALLHLGLMLATPLVIACLIGVGLWLRARTSTRRAARRKRKIVQEGSDPEQGIDVVRGRLRVGSEPVKQVRARGKVGAATAWLSSGRAVWSKGAYRGQGHRAASLVIEDGDREVRIDEEIVVVAGSEVRWPGKRIFTDKGHASLAWATVVDGDEVVARGRLVAKAREDAGADEDYRTAATQEVLAPVAGEPVVEVAAVTAPTVHMTARQVRTHPVAVIAALVACYFPIGAIEDYSDRDCGQMCTDYGACDIEPVWRYGSPQDAFKRVVDNDHFRCEAGSDAACRVSKGCTEYGNCTAKDGNCSPVTRTDCLHLSKCLTGGDCSPHEGGCRAGSEDCWHTDGCLDYGQCVGADGRCKATTDEHCAASKACAAEGKCAVYEDGRCGATRDEHCAPTYGCRSDGKCKAKGGECVATDEICRNRHRCQSGGQCHASTSFCSAKTDSDCVQSRGCAEYRHCVMGEYICSEEDAPTCRASAACTVHGHCDGGAVCEATSAEDCKASKRCATHGECRLMNETCVKTCEESWDCRDRGRCTEQDGECVAGGDADCAASVACRNHGHCTEDRGRCEVGTSKDCQGTAACRFRGQCTKLAYSCVATSDADCQRTVDCEVLGHCTYRKGGCVAAGDDCRATRTCKERGDCTAIYGQCRVGSDAECQAAAVCQRNGWCKRLLVEGLDDRINVCFTRAPR